MVGIEGQARPRGASRASARQRIRQVAAVATGILAIAAVGVGVGLLFRPSTVRGHVIAVEAREIGHASAITIRDLDGADHVLDVDRTVDMTPGHLREHMMYGEPVTATLGPTRGASSRPVVVRIVDGLQ